ncbi:rhodanese-related sulfurtransferase [Flavobacterium sp. 7E]|uniref:rhodanese-like domain-containing protein n=1 Tax=unclassified Flavobacterium TaxID=196869 RepID=UPI00156FE2D6|nr:MULTISPECIES: rhodanese-like domain-containing protein [unclassified Flavobacterium]MBE0393387.1 Thiosulfate sulfurtransferase PspE [Flavobacterium sp. PL002]NRS89101.1 rhodanese-related sulfurtransferase [Flavobacterium sp. 7E]NRT15373.1 rhodanese-related sulfurtransferase [Flavobacterium sp. 28A]
MIAFLKKIFGIGPAVNFSELVKQGAVIVDVRSPAEYKQGHVKGAINLPLNELSKHLSKLKKDATIITCCASGMRSASAKSILKTNGYTTVYNGGGWSSLQNKL